MRIIQSVSAVLIVGFFFSGGALIGQEADSLHVRKPDSTNIVIDTETVPASVRSRGHQLVANHPLGFFPRDETGLTGFWQSDLLPQYLNTFTIEGLKIRSRLRPEVPLRYVPQHSIINFSFYENSALEYPLRTRMLRRESEPMVNLVYKQGYYELNGVSVGLALDVTDQTHLHLARESNSFVGQFGQQGIANERYYISVHHQVSDRTDLIYNTLYAKDDVQWTTGRPQIRRFGNDLTSWYQHFVNWRTRWLGFNWNYGLLLGSHRLWLKGDSFNDELNELQRSAWVGIQDSLSHRLSWQTKYQFRRFDLSAQNIQSEMEYWQQVTFAMRIGTDSLYASPSLDVAHVRRGSDALHFLPGVQFRLPLVSNVTVSGASEYEFGVSPWSWRHLPGAVRNSEADDEETVSRRFSAEIEWKPLQWLELSAGGKQYDFQNYHRLEYRNPVGISMTDSLVDIRMSDEDLLAATGSVTIRPAEWFSLGGNSLHILSESNRLAETWARHSMNGWLHARRYFFKNNLLAHLFLEGGMFYDRHFTGWHPALQSLTNYPAGDLQLNPSNYVHVQFIGEIGPFTISSSFYNIVGTNIAYAVDQRPHSTLFYLGVRWQLWE